MLHFSPFSLPPLSRRRRQSYDNEWKVSIWNDNKDMGRIMIQPWKLYIFFPPSPSPLLVSSTKTRTAIGIVEQLKASFYIKFHRWNLARRARSSFFFRKTKSNKNSSLFCYKISTCNEPGNIFNKNFRPRPCPISSSAFRGESIYLIKYFPALPVHPHSTLKLPMKHSDFFFLVQKFPLHSSELSTVRMALPTLAWEECQEWKTL